MDLLIDNRQDKIEVNKDMEKEIEKAIEASLLYEKNDLNYEISMSLVDNEEIQVLNREYRGIDRETDVLSFPLDNEFVFGDIIILGDIIISVEKALEQSKEYNHSFLREIIYLTVHSMFHLMGYDHIDEKEKESMRKKEEEVLKKIGIKR